MPARVLKDMIKSFAPGATRRFDPLVLVLATLATAAVLVPLVVAPQWLSREARLDMLRSHVGDIGELAASVVDGDLHRKLLDPKNYTPELYARALKPLVRFHSADPNIYYLYTMADIGGVAHFVLDTAASPDLHTAHPLRASKYMEKFEIRESDDDDWLQQIASGKTYVTPSFEQDDYGTFLTAHTPIYDSQGRHSGFVGVDFDLQFYTAREARFRAIAIGSVAAALLISMVVGYLVSVYSVALGRRMQDLHEASIRDGLTGLLNRRGALEVIREMRAPEPATNASLLIDIDNLKMINDLKGHVTGDAVIARTADILRASVREGDECARVGGDEFMVLAANCDEAQAEQIARRILHNLSHQSLPLAGAKFNVSIGIAVLDAASTDFAHMYRDADAALYQGRSDGKSRIGVFQRESAPSMA